MTALRKISTEVVEAVSTAAGYVAEKTEEAARYSKLRLELPHIKAQERDLYRKIGEEVCKLAAQGTRDTSQSETISDLLRQVHDCEEKINSVHHQIETLRAERDKKRAEHKELRAKQIREKKAKITRLVREKAERIREKVSKGKPTATGTGAQSA